MRSFPVWLLAGLMAWSGAPHRIQAQSASLLPAFSPAHDAHWQSLSQAVRAQGAIRLIVELELPPGKAGEPEEGQIALAQASLLEEVGATTQIVQAYRYIPFVALIVDEAGLEVLRHQPGVISVQQDEIVAPLLVESTELIGADIAWNYGGTGVGQTIAIVDTGVDYSHDFLIEKVVAEGCFSSNYASGSFESISVCLDEAEVHTGEGSGLNCDLEMDSCKHGTRVAGIAAGSGEGLSGVAPEASILPVQVFSKFVNYCSGGPCARSWTSDQVAGLEYIYELRETYPIAVVNMSLGAGHFTSQTQCDDLNPALESVIGRLREANIAVVAASGNSGQVDGMVAPACLTSATSVGATTKTGDIASFSTSAEFLDLLAPGQGITSSVPGDQFASASGTSFSAPHIAGAWAVLKSRMPEASADEIESVLKTTGEGMVDDRNNIVIPLIHLDAAIESMLLPVSLRSFYGVTFDDVIELRWETTSEINNAGFEVEHLDEDRFSSVGYVEGIGTSDSVHSYAFQARGLPPGLHQFRLKQIDFDGTSAYSEVIDVEIPLEARAHLGPAYPNPFNPETQFTLTLSRAQFVEVVVYNLMGQRIATIAESFLEEGLAHSFTFNASHLPSGTYLILAIGEGFREVRKVTLLK